ncbi:hypothetical protein [Lacinutrix sp. Bg11-31]|uniref:hypothetical protein n=1 Tax=Lacinutrix sp. Bg11-31 TaxID=2057808 RepID=UPI000C31B5EB|nr:hypothetical protein [Lacinutrix sp. Bg11-31]AUC81830.1 hypothetical protein CW733_06665 [Lacinutrix sp. Bg11-31]
MKKIIFTLLLVLPLLTFGQKIKLKKGLLTIDGNAVAKVNDDTRNFYKFKTLDGEKVFDVAFKGLSASNLEGFQWLEMTSVDGKVTEIPYEVLMTSFNTTKLIVKLLSSKYELLDASGLKTDKIAAFFAQEREKLSDKYTKAVVSAKADAATRQKAIGAYNPHVKDNGTVVFGGSQGTKIVGKVIYQMNPNRTSYYVAKDLDGITVATASGCSTCTETTVKTYTDQEFSYDYGSKTMMTGRFSNSQAKIFIEELVGRGYKLGREAKTKGRELRNEKVKIAKENSINLYGVSGSATDKEGEVFEGTLYAIFEKLSLDESQTQSGIADIDAIDNYGKTVSVKYTNAKGRKRTKKLMAKQGASFCTEIEGEKACFYGMKTKGNALKKLSNAMSLGFNNSYFYKEVKEINGHQLLVKPGDKDIYVIKFKNKDAGFMIDGRNNEKASEAFSKFLKEDCKTLSEDIENNEFDLKNVENLINIIEEYDACK